MNIEKEFSSISLPITEPEYRQLPELSYSTLSTYESLGYNGLDHLFDKKESPSLKFGSIVDCLITGSQEEFNSLYYVADFPSLGDKELQIATVLFDQYGRTYNNMGTIPATYILDLANTYEFQKNWKDETRVRVLTERCAQYYSLKCEAGDKIVVSMEEYNDAQACFNALRESPATCGYFADNDPMSPVRRYYQLKFKAQHNNVGYRNMADLILVDYEEKKVYPIDLKTSSHTEWDFEASFKQWKYMIQARLYWRIIRANMDKDPFFKDFTLENYRFIVVNRKTLTPLVWEFPLTTIYGTLVDEKGNEYRDPFEIGEELQAYLNCKPPVPNGINMNGINIIQCLKLKE